MSKLRFLGSVEYRGKIYEKDFLNNNLEKFEYALQNDIGTDELDDWVSVENLLMKRLSFASFKDFVEVVERVWGDDASIIRNDHYDSGHFGGYELNLIEIILDEKEK